MMIYGEIQLIGLIFIDGIASIYIPARILQCNGVSKFLSIAFNLASFLMRTSVAASCPKYKNMISMGKIAVW